MRPKCSPRSALRFAVSTPRLSKAAIPFAVFAPLVVVCALVAPVCAQQDPNPALPAGNVLANQPAIGQNYGKLPLSFAANLGQADRAVLYTARGNGYSLDLTRSAAVLSLAASAPRSCRSATAPHLSGGKTPAIAAPSADSQCASGSLQTDTIALELLRGNPRVQVEGTSPLPGKASYFLGKDPSAWHSDIPTYSRVEYKNVYPGIDLAYYGNQQRLEYDFILAPNADPKPIRLRFAGARKLELAPDGTLKVIAAHGSIAFHAPVAYQRVDGIRKPVSGRFTLMADNSVGFSVGSYDRAAQLVIDPVLAYSTYLGGSGGDFGLESASAIAIDAAGNAYIAGVTSASDFPLSADAVQRSNKIASSSETTAFVSKLNPTGTALLYSTYLGGSGGTYTGDVATAIAVDSSGAAYIAGYTGSSDFPVTSGAFQSKNNDNCHYVACVNAFVAKLNPEGTALAYSTYLGGGTSTRLYGDAASSIAVDSSGNAYIAGSAGSLNFPVTAGAYQTTNKSVGLEGENAFLSKLNPSGSALVYSTYLGGTTYDSAAAIAVDSSGDAYLAGSTASQNFPTTPGAFQSTNKNAFERYGAVTTAFVTKFNQTGDALVYSTYLGGQGSFIETPIGDSAGGIAVDALGQAYVAGSTASSDFPVTAGGLQTRNKAASNGTTSAFVAKLNAGGSGLVYSTYLGGSGIVFSTPNGPIASYGDSASSIAVDASGNAYVGGISFSTDFPVTSGAFQKKNAAAANLESNGFLSAIAPTGASLLYSTYVGGSGYSGGSYNATDQTNAIAVSAVGIVYLAGMTTSTDFPVTAGAFTATYDEAGGGTGFVTKLDLPFDPPAPPAPAAPKPAVWPAPGKYLGSVSVTLSANIPNPKIYYTLDGTVPTLASALYSAPISLTNAATVKAIATGAGYSPSLNIAAEYSMIPVAPTPILSPAAGAYAPGQTVTISDPDPTATLRYTTDGTIPTTASKLYTHPIVLTGSETIQAIAIATNDATSTVASATYTPR